MGIIQIVGPLQKKWICTETQNLILEYAIFLEVKWVPESKVMANILRFFEPPHLGQMS